MRLIVLLCLLITYCCFLSCSTENRGKELANSYCGACHLVPDPQLLDKTTWQNQVLPYMEVWMGRKPIESISEVSFDDIDRINQARILPAQPLLPDDKWNEIVKYYLKNAPEKLPANPKINYQPLENIFNIKPFGFQTDDISMLRYNATNHQMAIGNRLNELLMVDIKTAKVIKNIRVSSPAMDIMFEKDGQIGVTLAGTMDPHDNPTGLFGLATIENQSLNASYLIRKLARPVGSVMADLNNDGKKDVVVASYGNIIGDLSWYEFDQNKQPIKHLIKNAAGALQIFVRDVNKDNLPDLITLWGQGDESVSIFINKGKGRFEEQKVLRFPPVYGTLAMELVDFDHDGDEDIVYCNGDNGDKSRILKPYHGIRLFLNDGKYHFSEKYFFPMHGVMKTQTRDFDKDGDLDIAAISFFPDFNASPQQNFVYLQNNGKWQFVPHSSSKTDVGRWMVMETADYDQDGDEDLLLGSCLENKKNTQQTATKLMMLENK
jgi:FG-GAP-like repeat